MSSALPVPDMDTTWMRDAVCKHSGVDMFGDDTAAALQVCEGCPVSGPCLSYALASGPMLSGVWGNTTQKQRVLSLMTITHCPHGHAYDEHNLMIRDDGRPRCRACNVEHTRRSKARKAVA